MKKEIKLIFIAAIFLTACNPAKYIYVRESGLGEADSNFYSTHKINYQLQPGDMLYMSVHSSLTEAENLFQFPSQGNTATTINVTNTNSTGNMYLTQYVVSDSGTIRIPVIGIIYVAGYTVKDLQEVIEMEAHKYVPDAMIKIKLVSFTVTFLGEFTRPGKITFYKDHVNILDAIGEVGEITYNGDREHVRVMRQTPDGIYTYQINLNDVALLSSEKFYLQPNDIIYAEPLGRKILRTNVADYALLLTTITSTLAFVALIISLQNK